MRTIASSQCEEFYQLHDFVDILESYLPSDDSCPEERGKVTIWRDKLALMGERELDGGIGPYDSIMSIADDMFRYSLNWMFDKPTSLKHDDAFELLDFARLKMIDLWGERLSDYSAKRYISSLESQIEDDRPSLRFKLCSQEFTSESILNIAHLESLGWLRHEIADLTGELTPRPGTLEVFDADKVDIKRNWVSTTQLTTAIYYDGVKLGDFKDNAILHTLGHHAPEMTETNAVRAARRIFYLGHQGRDLEPLSTSTFDSMYHQLRQDLETAKTLLSDSPGKMADLDRMEGALANQYPQYATPQQGVPVLNPGSPGVSL